VGTLKCKHTLNWQLTTGNCRCHERLCCFPAAPAPRAAVFYIRTELCSSPVPRGAARRWSASSSDEDTNSSTSSGVVGLLRFWPLECIEVVEDEDDADEDKDDEEDEGAPLVLVG